jgi:hypothetical protein
MVTSGKKGARGQSSTAEKPPFGSRKPLDWCKLEVQDPRYLWEVLHITFVAAFLFFY